MRRPGSEEPNGASGIFFPLLLGVTAVVKIPEGVVIGIKIFAWTPN